MDQKDYDDGDIVWVKLGNCWWPGEVCEQTRMPAGILKSVKKRPLYVVQFFDEGKYEYVKNKKNICKYSDNRKNEFIRKGLDLFRSNKKYMEKFPGDVSKAERLTDGDPDIISSAEFSPVKRSSYSNIFGGVNTPDSGTAKKKNGRKVKETRTIAKKISPAASIRTNISVLSTPIIPRTNNADSYNCKICSFTTNRCNIMIIHMKTHARTSTTPKGNDSTNSTLSPIDKPNVDDRSEIENSLRRKLQMQLARESHDSPDEDDEPIAIVKLPPKARKTPKKPGLKHLILADWSEDEDDNESQSQKDARQLSNKSVNISLQVSSEPTKALTPPTAAPKIRNIPKKDRRDIVLNEFNNILTPSNDVVVVEQSQSEIVEKPEPIEEIRNEQIILPIATDGNAEGKSLPPPTELPIEIKVPADPNEATNQTTKEPTTNTSCFDFKEDEDENDDFLSSLSKLKEKYLSPEKKKSIDEPMEDRALASVGQNEAEKRDEQLAVDIENLLNDTRPPLELKTESEIPQDVRALPPKERGKRIFKSRNRSRLEKLAETEPKETAATATTKDLSPPKHQEIELLNSSNENQELSETVRAETPLESVTVPEPDAMAEEVCIDDSVGPEWQKEDIVFDESPRIEETVETVTADDNESIDSTVVELSESNSNPTLADSELDLSVLAAAATLISMPSTLCADNRIEPAAFAGLIEDANTENFEDTRTENAVEILPESIAEATKEDQVPSVERFDSLQSENDGLVIESKTVASKSSRRSSRKKRQPKKAKKAAIEDDFKAEEPEVETPQISDEIVEEVMPLREQRNLRQSKRQKAREAITSSPELRIYGRTTRNRSKLAEAQENNEIEVEELVNETEVDEPLESDAVQTVEEVARTVEKVTGTTEEVAETVEEVTETVEETTETAEEVTKTVEDVAETVEDVAETVEEVTETEEDVAETIEEVTETVQEVAETVEEVTETDEQVAESIEEVAETIKEVAETIEEVAAASEEILQPIYDYESHTTPENVEPHVKSNADPVLENVGRRKTRKRKSKNIVDVISEDETKSLSPRPSRRHRGGAEMNVFLDSPIKTQIPLCTDGHSLIEINDSNEIPEPMVSEIAVNEVTKISEFDGIDGNIESVQEAPAIEVTDELEAPAIEGTDEVEVPAIEATDEVEAPAIETTEEPEAPAIEATEKLEAPTIEAIDEFEAERSESPRGPIRIAEATEESVQLPEAATVSSVEEESIQPVDVSLDIFAENLQENEEEFTTSNTEEIVPFEENVQIKESDEYAVQLAGDIANMQSPPVADQPVEIQEVANEEFCILGDSEMEIVEEIVAIVSRHVDEEEKDENLVTRDAAAEVAASIEIEPTDGERIETVQDTITMPTGHHDETFDNQVDTIETSVPISVAATARTRRSHLKCTPVKSDLVDQQAESLKTENQNTETYMPVSIGETETEFKESEPEVDPVIPAKEISSDLEMNRNVIEANLPDSKSETVTPIQSTPAFEKPQITESSSESVEAQQISTFPDAKPSTTIEWASRSPVIRPIETSPKADSPEKKVANKRRLSRLKAPSPKPAVTMSEDIQERIKVYSFDDEQTDAVETSPTTTTTTKPTTKKMRFFQSKENKVEHGTKGESKIGTGWEHGKHGSEKSIERPKHSRTKQVKLKNISDVCIPKYPKIDRKKRLMQHVDTSEHSNLDATTPTYQMKQRSSADSWPIATGLTPVLNKRIPSEATAWNSGQNVVGQSSSSLPVHVEPPPSSLKMKMSTSGSKQRRSSKQQQHYTEANLFQPFELKNPQHRVDNVKKGASRSKTSRKSSADGPFGIVSSPRDRKAHVISSQTIMMTAPTLTASRSKDIIKTCAGDPLFITSKGNLIPTNSTTYTSGCYEAMQHSSTASGQFNVSPTYTTFSPITNQIANESPILQKVTSSTAAAAATSEGPLQTQNSSSVRGSDTTKCFAAADSGGGGGPSDIPSLVPIGSGENAAIHHSKNAFGGVRDSSTVPGGKETMVATSSMKGSRMAKTSDPTGLSQSAQILDNLLAANNGHLVREQQMVIRPDVIESMLGQADEMSMQQLPQQSAQMGQLIVQQPKLSDPSRHQMHESTPVNLYQTQQQCDQQIRSVGSAKRKKPEPDQFAVQQRRIPGNLDQTSNKQMKLLHQSQQPFKLHREEQLKLQQQLQQQQQHERLRQQQEEQECLQRQQEEHEHLRRQREEQECLQQQQQQEQERLQQQQEQEHLQQLQHEEHLRQEQQMQLQLEQELQIQQEQQLQLEQLQQEVDLQPGQHQILIHQTEDGEGIVGDQLLVQEGGNTFYVDLKNIVTVIGNTEGEIAAVQLASGETLLVAQTVDGDTNRGGAQDQIHIDGQLLLTTDAIEEVGNQDILVGEFDADAYQEGQLIGNVLQIETSEGIKFVQQPIEYQLISNAKGAATNETNAIMPPIMSTLEIPSSKSELVINSRNDSGHKTTSETGLIGQNLNDSLAVIGVPTQSTAVPSSLELPITITNPAIAPKTSNPIGMANIYGQQSQISPPLSSQDASQLGYELFTSSNVVVSHNQHVNIFSDGSSFKPNDDSSVLENNCLNEIILQSGSSRSGGVLLHQSNDDYILGNQFSIVDSQSANDSNAGYSNSSR